MTKAGDTILNSTHEYVLLAEETASQLTRSHQTWTSFLTTAARLYKYPYHEQLLIHAQRPEATACADYNVWNKTMGRYVRRGSKGIALFDATGNTPKLRYVFDIADTGTTELSRPFSQWEIIPQNTVAAMNALEENYAVSKENGFDWQLLTISNQLANDYWLEHKQDIIGILDDSFLAEYDEFNVGAAFRNAAYVSLEYTLLSRCGYNPNEWFEAESFQPIFDWNTPEAAATLGTAVSEMSEKVLRQIEIAVRNHERSHENERIDLQTERGLLDSEPHLGGNHAANRQVRQDAPNILNGTPTNTVQFPVNQWETVPAPVGNRGNSAEQVGGDDAKADESEQHHGGDESTRPDEMGRDDEQPESASGGNHLSGTDSQLTPAITMDDASLNQFLIGSRLAFSDIDNILRAANNQTNGDQRIYLKYVHNVPPSDIADYLKHEYQTGGRGLQIGMTKVSAWWDKDGLLIGVGQSALQASDRLFLSWEQVETRIRHLVHSGTYLAPERAAQATENEIKRLSNQIIFTYRDDMQGICEMPQEWNGHDGSKSYPDVEKNLAALLSMPDARNTILDTLEHDYETLIASTNVRQRRMNSVERLVSDLRHFAQPALSLNQEHFPALGFPFITDDEIDAYLGSGSHFSDGKARILMHFLNTHTQNEAADFLKNEYGTGGSTRALSRADNSYEDHNSKGIALKRGNISAPYAKVEMNWNQVAKRIDTLINEGRYFTQADVDDFRGRYTRDTVANAISTFYYDVNDAVLPIGTERPFDDNLYITDKIKAIAAKLESPEQVAEICTVMEQVFPLMPRVTRNYAGKAESLKTMQAYRDGTLDLIPLLPTVPVNETILSTVNSTPFIPLMGNYYDEENQEMVDEQPSAQEEESEEFDSDDEIIDLDYEDGREFPPFSDEKLIMGIIANHTDDLSYKQAKVDIFFSLHPDLSERAEHIKAAYPHQYTEIMVNKKRVGYLPKEDGLLMWEGSYLSRTKESVFSWNLIAEFTAQQIAEKNNQQMNLFDLVEQTDSFAYEEPALPISPTEQEHDEAISHAEERKSSAFSIPSDSVEAIANTYEPLFVPSQMPAFNFSFDTVAHMILERVMQDKDYLSDLSEAKTRASMRNPCGWALEDAIRRHEEDEPEIYEKYWADNDWRERLFQYVHKESYARKPTSEQQADLPIDLPKTEHEPPSQVIEKPNSPQPVFFVNWEEARRDFDLRLYKDQDTVGYDVNGVKYTVGKSNDLAYVTSTGFLMGGNEVPDNIYEQLSAYQRGELTDEQVRENYRATLHPVIVESAPATEQDEAVNLEELVRLELEARGFDTSDDLAKNGLSDFKAHGGRGDVQDIADFIENEYSLRYELEYTYQDNQLIIRNIIDTTPDTQAPIIAHVESDGRVVYIDETLPYSVQREIERIDTDDLERYREDAEYELQQTADNAETNVAIDNEGKHPNPMPIMPSKQNRTNFRITDDNLGYGGQKTKYQMNTDAIRILKQIESESRLATPDEQEILSKYVGWGGMPQAFDDLNESWAKEYSELKELLNGDEYVNARASTLNAHYTSPVVIKAMYDAIEKMGFSGGNILEPACGVGNFLGLLPDSLAESRMFGVELDSITGRMAQQLYPNASITVAGFETTNQRDFYDLAIGNVPFGDYQVSDKAYNKLGFRIHDYFFAKSIDQVRPGGVLAFITSKGTLDKRSSEVRKYIAQRADLLGAVRLPNNAFKSNAGTEVTSDIIFLQKREQPLITEPDWVHLGVTEDGLPINSYFVENPHMVLGQMKWDNRMYGNEKETTCEPIEGADLSEQLSQAMQHIHGEFLDASLPELGDGVTTVSSLPADPDVKNFSYTIVNGEVYYRENSRMIMTDLNAIAKERVRGLVEMRDCVHDLINQQMNGAENSAIRETQLRLNELYDDFTKKHGIINSRGNALAFSEDSSYYLLCSLEILDENGELSAKADMFTKRTIRPAKAVDHVDTASEALALSISEKAQVDMGYMAQLSGKTEEELASDLRGVIFPLPSVGGDEKLKYVAADEYLSGNIRTKLGIARQAAETSALYRDNVVALEKAMPKDLDASEIEVRLGTTWIDPSYIQSFMNEVLALPSYLQRTITANYTKASAEWRIQNKSRVAYNDIAAFTTYGTKDASAYEILEESLNLRDVRIYMTIRDEANNEKRVIDKKATMLAQQKQQSLKDAFQDWIWKDPDRRQELTEQYNVLFNSIRPREYNGEHITLSGINPEFSLRAHQQDAVAHIIYGQNVLLAHEVGAGKSATRS